MLKNSEKFDKIPGFRPNFDAFGVRSTPQQYIRNLKSLLRSSAAEYLTYVAAIGDSSQSVEMRYENENIWLTQKMMAELYGVDVRTINNHVSKVFKDGELPENPTIRNFRIVQTEGSRQVSRDVLHYNLQMIIAVGFKVNNERAVQFRKWAGQIVKDYTIQGWAMDKDRLKNFGSILTEDYFERQLEAIREIRVSERRFYQKVTLLTNAGKISMEVAQNHAITEWEKYRIVQDKLFHSDFDYFLELHEKIAEYKV